MREALKMVGQAIVCGITVIAVATVRAEVSTVEREEVSTVETASLIQE